LEYRDFRKVIQKCYCCESRNLIIINGRTGFPFHGNDIMEGFSMIDKIEGFSMIDKIEELDSRFRGNDIGVGMT